MGLIIYLIFLKPIKFQADSLFYDAGKKVFYLYRNVKIDYENITLYSDTVLFYQEKNLMYAYGNAKLKSGKDSLKGEKIVYSLQTQKGKVTKGKTKIEKGILWAEEIFKVDKDNLKAFKAHYTTCDLDSPHYFFLSSKVKTIPKKDIIAQPVIMFIRDFPVLYLPFWIFPATRERKSGFLTPKPGRNSLLGLYLKNITYYWAINNYMDFTFGFDLYERRGVTILSDYEYKIFKTLEGNINGTFTREINPKRERWSINAIHSQNMPFNIKMQAKADFISDQTYATDYSEYRPERLKSESYSFLTLSKNFKISSLNLTLDHRDDFLNKKKETRVPHLSLNLFGKQIGPMRCEGGFNFLRKITKDTTKKTEDKFLSMNQGFFLQNNILGIFNVTSSANFSQKIYPEDTLQNKYPVSHNISLNTSSAITFYGKSIIKPPFFDNFYHLATLSLGYSYRPGFRAINVKGEGPKNPSSSMNLSLKNDYYVKKENKKYSLINFYLSSNYDFLKKEKKFSNINFTGTIPLPFNFSGSSSFIYNPYTGKIESSDLRLSYNINLFFTDKILPSQEKLNLNGTYTYQRNIEKENHLLSSQINGRITKMWNFSYNFTYTSEEKRVVSQSLNLTRDLHCFSLEIRWSKTGPFYDYQFRIWIKEIPDLKIERNFFETILPSLQE
ncbi:MAG: putative LPS assembly protein LptD [candidate division WOR-3 bacterium]